MRCLGFLILVSYMCFVILVFSCCLNAVVVPVGFDCCVDSSMVVTDCALAI